MPDLPLFPLNTVLFPGGTLPLHIFEQRYRLMIGECIDQESPFGVVLIKSGREVGGPVEPYSVGTTARIAQVQQLPDGRLNIVAVGVERFRIEEITQRRPYLRASLEILEDAEGETPGAFAQAQTVAQLYDEYYRLALALTDQWQRRTALPDQPRALADYVANRIEVEAQLKQQLLELVSVEARLDTEAQILTEATRLLADQLVAARRQKYAGLGAQN